MITVFADNKEVPVNMVEFSDGALTFKLDKLPKKPNYISINVNPSTPVYRVREEIGIVVNCIEHFYKSSTLKGLPFPVTLNMPYTCYGRADRVFEEGNPNTLYVFLRWLKGLNFTRINICDLHNSKVLKDWYIDEGYDPVFHEKSQLDCFKDSLPHDFVNDYDLVVAPDRGATEKAKTIADHLGIDIIYTNKVRDISTGKIVDMTLPEGYDLQGKKVLVPDDLADKAGTHIWLSDLLRGEGVKEVDLYVTHAILPDGLGALKGKIDKLICYQTVTGYINNEDVMNFNLGK